MKETNSERMDETDRISSLPDCLLQNILSLLETKESIRTSVLSKRWISVWKSVPRLDLLASDFNQVGNFETSGNLIFHHKLFPNPEKLGTFILKCATVTPRSMEYHYDGEMLKLLKGLSNAKIIELAGLNAKDMLEMESSDLPVFEKLRSLTLCDCTLNKDLGPVASFLKHTPNLNKLTLKHVLMEKNGVLQEGSVFNDIVQCYKLTTIEIVCWKGQYTNVHTLLKYLLIHLPYIENITINQIIDDGDSPQEN